MERLKSVNLHNVEMVEGDIHRSLRPLCLRVNTISFPMCFGIALVHLGALFVSEGLTR